MLRCKFRVEMISKEDTGRQLRLSASNEKDGDNKDWSQWTPSGKLELFITNQSAFPAIDAMNLGDHFWIDISPIQKV